MRFEYDAPCEPAPASSKHHADAAAGNEAVVTDAITVLKSCVSGGSETSPILLKAAAGAGKSFALRRMVKELVDDNPGVNRIAVTAFTNNQVEALARSLTKELGRDRVGWFISKSRLDTLDPAIFAELNICTRIQDFGDKTDVFVATSHKFGAIGELGRIRNAFGVEGYPFDVLFVDEAWQLPEHLFAPIANHAPTVVGVGDVGQLPPIEIGTNPWRGDERYNPYRAWPHSREGADSTWSRELPTVWRPAGEQLALWRAFYPDWAELCSVAAPGDRRLDFIGDKGALTDLIDLMATGVPVLLEVDGLPDAEAPDVDLPLTIFAEHIVDSLVSADVHLVSERYANDGSPTGSTDRQGLSDDGDTKIVLLATRNQAVDDAADAVDRIVARHQLSDNSVVASTVDSWQGQTNGVTVAIHPLSGADQLDEFNSAFGRLAVTCTRATHALLILARPGLDDLLVSVPARPGTPFGEPGERQLPRQTHQRILGTFARARVTLEPVDLEEWFPSVPSD